MRFGVLGPLEVRTEDGRPVPVPDRKVRALLADLLAHAGRAVSADRLVDDLWGDALPADPPATLRARVSQLRRTLEDAEPGARALVETSPPGYRLAARTDAADFADLAGRAADEPDPAARASRFAEALALWRGPAFADFADAPFAAPEIARLDELRLAALEGRAEARLQLGEDAALAAELREAVDEHPFRERLRAAHMRALYRAGRPADALAAYDDLRVRLRDDLGLDPPPALAALHASMLRRDPAAGGRRGNLPADVAPLVGRDAAVRELAALLEESRLVTLHGTGGVGKTRLAVAVARALRGPGEVWLVRLDEGLEAGASADDAASFTAGVLGLRDDAGSGGGPAARLGEALGGRRALLVLDNCEHVAEPVARLAAALLRDVADLRVLATSREPLAISGERLWTVPPLDAGAAAALFAQRAGLASGPGDAGPVAAICARLDGVPLALELAATRVRALGLAGLAERLDDRFRLLSSGARDAPPRQRTLRALIDWSWEPLEERERAVLRRLAVHAGGCTLDAAEAVCGADVETLAGLVDRSLVVAGEGPRYRLLETVAAYGAERLREAGEEERVRRRHAEYYIRLAERADLRGPGQRDALRLLRAETGNLRAALDGAVRAGDAGRALRLVNAMGWAWFLWGRVGEACRAFERALAVPGAADPASAARARTWRTGFAMLDGDGADRDERVREALAADGDPWARWFLGFVRGGFGDLEAIDELAARALDGFRARGDDWGEAAALAVRAGQALSAGDLPRARHDGERALRLFGAAGDRWGRLQATETLGVLAEVAGDYARARELHESGLRDAEELGLRAEAAGRMSRLGRVALLEGDLDRADDLHERGRRLAVRESHRRMEHFAEVGLALAARRRGRLAEAEAILRRWLGWCRDIEGAPGLAFLLAELGFIAELRGDAAGALALHTEGLAAARATGHPRAVALAREGLAGALSLAGRRAEAARSLAAASRARAAVGAPLPEAERGDVDRIAARLD
ncbi:putative ATPase/DNA-binding winged helix-turn-helix (wHTH) protein [Actinomadura coerulea]|uniref:Putative ATPase/DNA-binding winged helix-turn-helix (WHTH) protein n=1 Tax=Actinomadura coerulea TaxID=46159 RepID=A0A7X0G082_9ACTN|nr:BTAD domain-containing putative transcriptional regulator [Actinomadura coerulea]MBB6396794.1 putative ATPase/DNA-binding winged helix-turn-helix (wHTH) protein [Actinomadura coerulea]GGP94590.1 SARP family transcriptional regulator [Actinomadura coerulea]